MSGKKSPYPDGRIPDRLPMAAPQFPGSHAGPKASFLCGLSLLQEEWPSCLLWVYFSTVPTQALAPLDQS